MSPRYAVYFAPGKASPWRTFGAGWLGRDECSNLPLKQADLAGISREELHALTEAPRRYGFHATLKAPFHLQKNTGLNDLLTRLGTLAKQFKPVELGPLSAVHMDQFVALVPQSLNHKIASLATKCVTELDDLRAPLTALEMARRNVDMGDARGQFLLKQYGYPHVLERFIFHFTLSGPVAPPMADHLLQTVMHPLQQLNQSAPLVLDRLCLFEERTHGAPFMLRADMELSA